MRYLQTLNKEQGIQWVKRERLPLFLNSDYYIEYRLARLVSQAQAAQGPGLSIKLDYSAKQEKVEEEVVEDEPEVDETEVRASSARCCTNRSSCCNVIIIYYVVFVRPVKLPSDRIWMNIVLLQSVSNILFCDEEN